MLIAIVFDVAWQQIFKELQKTIKEVPLFAILTRNISSNFSPEFLYVITHIAEKKLHVTDLSKSTFCKGLQVWRK